MAKFMDWTTDVESKNIAEQLQKKYEMFSAFDLSKVAFMRVKGKDSKDVAKTTGSGFPFDAFTNFVYFVFVYDTKWALLSNDQRKVAIFQQLMSMYPEGFDTESNYYAKIRKKDVSEYSEVLCAVGGQFHWQEIGTPVPDLLDDKVVGEMKERIAKEEEKEKDAEEA